MKCRDCPAYGFDYISPLCVLRHPITRGYCNRKKSAIKKELKEFLETDSRALQGYYTLPRYETEGEGEI